MEKLITVFTPTYNRKSLIPHLYKSLCEQDCQDFVWLVVDDGSSDGSGEYFGCGWNVPSELGGKSVLYAMWAKSADSSELTAVQNVSLKKYTGSGSDVAIPEGIKTVFSYAFSGCPVETVILPKTVTEVMSLAIYGMFIAIVVPAAKESRRVLGVVAIAAAVSCLMYYVPVLKEVSVGFAIIVSAVAAGALGAWLFPPEDGGACRE